MKAILVFFLACTAIFAQDIHDEIIEGNIFSEERTGQDVAAFSMPELALDEALAQHDEALYYSKFISDLASEVGLNINSISNRKPKTVAEGVEVERVYFGYDADLPQLVRFFQTLEAEQVHLNVEALNISARRQPKRKSPRVNAVARKALNGNCILTFTRNGADREAFAHLPEYNMNNVVSSVLHSLTETLSMDAYATSIIIKRGSEVTFMGEAVDPFTVGKDLENTEIFSDVRAANAITTGRNNDGRRRFMYKAALVPEAFN